jgi:hypothetical protein
LALSNLPELDDQYDLIVLCRRSLGEDLDYAVRRGGTPDEGLVRQFVAEMQAGFEQSGIAGSFEVQALILRTRDGLPVTRRVVPTDNGFELAPAPAVRLRGLPVSEWAGVIADMFTELWPGPRSQRAHVRALLADALTAAGSRALETFIQAGLLDRERIEALMGGT